MVEIEFDPEKERINRAKHGAALTVAQFLLEGPSVRMRVVRSGLDEERWIVIGEFEDAIFTACYTMRESRYRIISVRRASRKERKRYGEAKS
jgi:uncharacterized protein